MTTTDAPTHTLEQQAALLTGTGFWKSSAVADVPSVVLSDGPHGLRYQSGTGDHLGVHASVPATCFPTAAAVGNSWDPEVARAIGAAVAREARAAGVGVLLGPGVNIKRSPLCGRNFEYYSEDPLLSGVLGAGFARGVEEQGVGTSVKHFAANNQETDRMRVSAEVDERTLREIYLPAFERIVTEVRPATVMCAYNRINGVPAAENRWLLHDLLREEWGYEGVVVSDWGAVGDRVAALAAGLDLEMPGTDDRSAKAVVAAVEAGGLDAGTVALSADRVAALAHRYARPAEPGTVDEAAHHDLARRLAAECVVLLRNERDTLPLTPGLRVAAIGAFADTLRFQGGGSSHVNATRTTTPLEALGELAAEHAVTLSHAPGFSLRASDAADPADAARLRAEAVEVAAGTDVAIVFAGLSEAEESEGFDRTTLELPAAQRELIRAVAAAAPRTVVVLVHGGVVTLEGWHDEVDAIVDGALPGQAGGGALADVLFGLAEPAGRLAETVPLRLQDTPSYLSFPGEQGVSRYGEGVFVGYRHHVSVDGPVRYPFGHGLSYTTVETLALDVVQTGVDTAEAHVTVANTGERPGAHLVQVYVATEAGEVRRPARELRAFAKVRLEPGETRTVVLPLDRRAFAHWDVVRHRFVVAAGEYRVQVGADAATVLREGALTLAGDPADTALSLESTVAEWFGHATVGPVLVAALAEHAPAQPERDPDEPDPLKMIDSMPMGRFLAFTGLPVPTEFLDDLMARSRGGA